MGGGEQYVNPNAPARTHVGTGKETEKATLPSIQAIC